MGLFCAHDIEKRLANAANRGVLKLENIHSYWRYCKPNNCHYLALNTSVEFVDDEPTSPPSPLLQIPNPQKVKAKRQPTGASNKAKKRRDQNAEQQRCFTQQDLSDFEYASIIGFTSEVQVPFSQFTFMLPPPSQLYSCPVMQYDEKFNSFTMVSLVVLTQVPSVCKRKNNPTAVKQKSPEK